MPLPSKSARPHPTEPTDRPPDTVASLLRHGLSRRGFLQAATGLLALAAWPRGTLGSPAPRAALQTPHFLTDAEFTTLEALCDRILPPDRDPGAKQLGAARYIERLLITFETDVPFLFAGGPSSGRNPYPDPWSGMPSGDFPPDDFETPIPPSAIQTLYWCAELYGGAAAGLPSHIEQQWGGTLRGLRDIYREGLAIVDSVAVSQHGAAFAALSVDDQDALLPMLDAKGVFPDDPIRGKTFFDLVIQHTIEGCFSAPEYGGNAGGAGWAMLGIEGDSQPLGYSLYVVPTKTLVERPDHPLSTPNPDELSNGMLQPKPLTPDGDAVQQTISDYTGLLEMLVPGACG